MNISDIASQNAQYYLKLTSDKLDKVSKRLASGSKLADPSEDPAASAVASNLDSAIRGLDAAFNSVQNLTSFAQTSDGFLNSVQGQLGQLSELAVRATDGTLNDSDRAALNSEFTKVRDGINNQIDNASFNGTKLFDPSTQVSASIDASGSNTYTLSIANASGDVSGLSSANVLSSSAAQDAIGQVSTAIQNIASSRSKVNADVAALSHTIDNISSEKLNTSQANSRISDADYAEESTNLARLSILNSAGLASLGQANLSSRTVLRLLT